MDVIGNVYAAVETWCRAGYCGMGYWMTAVLAYVIGPSDTAPTSQSPRKIPKKPKKSETTTSTVPKEVPSIVEIKRILPKHCFVPNLALSLYYTVKDIVLVLALYGTILVAEKQPFTVLYLAWLPVYCFLQGTVFWAIFVLGHDCGHGSFSTSPFLNDALGTFLHTIISVPYYPWKLSHKHHHKNTGNMDHDEIFYPVRESDAPKNSKGFIKGFGLGLGWIAYLIVGFTPRKLSHFNPFENIFVGHVLGCTISLLSLGAWFYALYVYGQIFGYVALTTHYLVPAFVFGSWLVVVTFLHHMDTGVAWYSDARWTNVRGQLSTVDRDYGWAHSLTHNIGTHQIHHLFSKIPHYHLEEATRHFRATFPGLVRRSDDPIMPAFFRLFNVFQAERRVSDDTEVYVWRGGRLSADDKSE